MAPANKNDPVMTEDYILQRSFAIVEKKCQQSNILQNNADKLLPRFQRAELQLGAVLGKGGYCTVSEVKKITLADNPTEAAPATKSSAPRDEHDDDLAYDELASSLGSMHISQDRKYMATRYLRHGKDARYAIKILSDDIKEDSQRFIAGVVDLAMEAKFLAVIRHPNIVKMRGMANLTPFEPGFFIVLDRLYDTMSERLKAWTKRASQLKGLGRMMDRKGEKKKEFAFDRFLVALDLCSALGFLHTNNIVYRDLKPDNLGFDVRGTLKLFDFGLSLELNDKLPKAENGMYQLSGNTGSLRYMAPEVALEKPYNHLVDVYSYGIMLWQMMSLKTPFEGYSVASHKEKVVIGGKRPSLEDMDCSEAVTSMVGKCWAEDISNRPEFSAISAVIRQEISALRGDTEDDVLDRSSRTEKSLAD